MDPVTPAMPLSGVVSHLKAIILHSMQAHKI